MVETTSGEGRTKRKTGKHLPAFLLLLIAESPAYGGALVTRLCELLPDWAIDSGGVYRMLRDMEERGTVESDWDLADAGAPRRVYRITEAGRTELASWRCDIEERKKGLDLFLNRYRALERNRKNGP